MQYWLLALRVHPLLGSAGPRGLAAARRIGEAIYSTQRGLDLTPSALQRVDLAALAEQVSGAQLAEAQTQGSGSASVAIARCTAGRASIRCR